MDFVADILLMLASFSVRMQFIAKAVLYGRAGVALFPDDMRLREIYAYALLLDGQTDEAAAVLGKAAQHTRNTAFLRARIALQQDAPATEREHSVRAYLRLEARHEQ